jgi:DNA-binding CsgD family transcriptional regulator
MALRTPADALPEVLRLLTASPAVQTGAEHATLSPAILTALGELVPSDAVVYDDVAPRTARLHEVSDSDGLDVPLGPEPDDVSRELLSMFWVSPAAARLSGDYVSAVTLSDLVSVRQWRQRGLYVVLRSDPDDERQLVLPLGGTHGRSRRVRFIRLRGLDFTDTDRALATVVRPLVLAHLQALEMCLHGVRPPTTRQREVLDLLAAGSSNAEIARRMDISPQTVRTHLQQIYARLGVSNRTEAVAAAGSLAAAPRPVTVRPDGRA